MQNLSETIKRLPADLQQKVFDYIEELNDITEEEVHPTGQEEAVNKPGKKNRWALAAKRLDSEGFMDGKSDQVKEHIRDFREGFSLLLR
jgi:hypothetical protein